MKKYSIGIAREDNDLRAIMGTYYTEEQDDEGRYYLAEEVDAEIATLNKMVAMKQDDWIEVCKENDALKERLRELCTMSTVEMMCENENVRFHVEEWEKRCLKAEADNQRLREALEEIKQAFRASLPEKGVPDEDMEIFILYPMFRAVLPIINDALREAK
jgi:hypothetical protein